MLLKNDFLKNKCFNNGIINSFIINRKNRYAVICFCWLVICFLLLFVIGYGAKENAMFLYSFYFAWAVLSLIVLLFKKLFELDKKENSKVKDLLLWFFALSFFIINLITFIDVLGFAISVYPL